MKHTQNENDDTQAKDESPSVAPDESELGLHLLKANWQLLGLTPEQYAQILCFFGAETDEALKLANRESLPPRLPTEDECEEIIIKALNLTKFDYRLYNDPDQAYIELTHVPWKRFAAWITGLARTGDLGVTLIPELSTTKSFNREVFYGNSDPSEMATAIDQNEEGLDGFAKAFNEAQEWKDRRIQELEAEVKALQHEMRMQVSGMVRLKELEAEVERLRGALTDISHCLGYDPEHVGEDWKFGCEITLQIREFARAALERKEGS